MPRDHLAAVVAVRNLLEFSGDDPLREGLRDTPARVVNAWEFWTSGYGVNPLDLLTTFEDGVCRDELVFQAAIPFFSLCEHHLCPFFGLAHVGYIPGTRVVGLSKIARVIEVFARRLQVQERLAGQIADTMMDGRGLSPLGVGVVLQARHLCMESRGVQKIGTVTTTTALRGNFKERPEVRAEFMTLVGVAMQGIKTI